MISFTNSKAHNTKYAAATTATTKIMMMMMMIIYSMSIY